MCEKKGNKGMNKINILGVTIRFNENGVNILKSYEVTNVKDMIIVLRIFKISTGYQSKRNLKSWIKEWKAHNRLYKLGLFKSHTTDCDLEENEKWWRLLAYQFLGI